MTVAADVSRTEAILLPALSSVAMRAEMAPLAERLGGTMRCTLVDWPGFGGEPVARRGTLSPQVLDEFLDRLVEPLAAPAIGIAAGHGATYLARAVRRHPGRFGALVLIAPTWRGPLPTMTRGQRPDLCRRVRATLDHPVTGPPLFGANMSAPVIRWMMREHVYADPAFVTPALVAAKREAVRRPGARFATAAFVSGALDPAGSRDAFLDLFSRDLPPVLVLRPAAAPQRSGAEMDALETSGRVDVLPIAGALAAHEEQPDAAAAAILGWLRVRELL